MSQSNDDKLRWIDSDSDSDSDSESHNEEEDFPERSERSERKKSTRKPGMIHQGAQKILEKYSQYRGARTIVSQDESSPWTPERTESLREMLQHFLTHKSKAMKSLLSGTSRTSGTSGTSVNGNGAAKIYVSAPRVVDDCVRFTIEPFFPKFDPSLVAQIDREIRTHLPGFSFYIGNAAETHSKNVRLIPSGGKSAFSVTVPTESMQPYFEFRPFRMPDKQLLLVFLVLLLALVVAVAYNFYVSYSSQGYSLVSGLYEAFVALGIL